MFTPLTPKQALCRVIPLCLLAIFFAALIISITNDMYAFVKPRAEFVLTVTEHTDEDTLAMRLHEGGIIQNPTVFKLYLRSKGKTEALPSLSGEWKLNAQMSYREIMNEIFSKK